MEVAHASLTHTFSPWIEPGAVHNDAAVYQDASTEKAKRMLLASTWIVVHDAAIYVVVAVLFSAVQDTVQGAGEGPQGFQILLYQFTA